MRGLRYEGIWPVAVGLPSLRKFVRRQSRNALEEKWLSSIISCTSVQIGGRALQISIFLEKMKSEMT